VLNLRKLLIGCRSSGSRIFFIPFLLFQ